LLQRFNAVLFTRQFASLRLHGLIIIPFGLFIFKPPGGLVHRCCPSVRLSVVCLSVAKMQQNAIFSKTKQCRAMVSILQTGAE